MSKTQLFKFTPTGLLPAEPITPASFRIRLEGNTLLHPLSEIPKCSEIRKFFRPTRSDDWKDLRRFPHDARA
jgi:hypothetical protein